MNAGIDAGDEIMLLVHALHLPHAQRHEGGECEQEEQGKAPGAPRRVPRASMVRFSRRGGQGTCPMSWLIIGIMLWLRWYITHNEPDSAIPTIMIVKISAITVQPFSDLVFMCRK